MHLKRLENIFQICELINSELPKIAALIVCDTEEKKTIVDDFQRNAPYTIFLKCFIHYKRNI